MSQLIVANETSYQFAIENQSHLHYDAAMYVCLCKAITDRQLKSAIDDGAKSVKALNTKLGVATGCGKCVSEVRCMLDDASESASSGAHGFQQQVSTKI